jgi:hypothetical protein
MRSKELGVVAFIVGASLLTIVGAKAQQQSGCNAMGDVKFICGPIAAEDLIEVPQSEWVIASGNGAGGAIHAISIKDLSTIKLFPTNTPQARLDTKTYNACPGPIDPAEGDKFRAHGLAIRPGRNGVHTVWAVHHGNRESVEAFEFDARAKPPTLTWVGCVISPENVNGNAITALPEGGFVLTNPRRRVENVAGEAWEWQAGKGWSIVPGSELVGPNGVDVSKDGKTLYMGARRNLVRLSRGQTPIQKDMVEISFSIDNVHWSPDGSLLVAGQGAPNPETVGECFRSRKCDGAFTGVALIDPMSLRWREIVRYPANDTWLLGTTALVVGKEIWVGTVSGSRIARFQQR